MLKSDFEQQVNTLAGFINKIEFEPVTQRTPYYHMGATITDAVLQAGLNYRYVVYPRVLRLLTKFSDYRTTCDFIVLMQAIPLSELIDWVNARKLQLISEISWILFDSNVENEEQLSEWLAHGNNVILLRRLKGVGPKTIDYLKMLSGQQTIAIDRHLFGFLRLAGIFADTYQEASEIYSKTAELLCISKYELDRKIWLYMSAN